MKLWLITQTENEDYDTYDSAVVAAKQEETARNTHPSGREPWEDQCHSWASTPGNVTVKLIGTTSLPYKDGEVVLASYNAG